MPSFTNKKQLKFVITLGTGTFGVNVGNRVTLVGYRSSVDIDKAGGMMMGALRAKIYGVSQQDMNSITTLTWKVRTWIPNTVEVFAIDGTTETLVYAGNIVNAWGEYCSMPDVYLNIYAQSCFFNQMLSVAPRSFKGQFNVAKVMGQIAAEAGLTFENNGVDIIGQDLYLPNTGLEQAKDLQRQTGIDMYIDDKVLAICPANGARAKTIPQISPESGLVGYPTFDGVGVNFRSVFNPSITFGGAIELKTDILQASGQWVVSSVAHCLSAEMPGGPWFSNIRGNQSGLAITH